MKSHAHNHFPKIIIASGALKMLPAKVKNISKTFTIITDKNLAKLGEELRSALRKEKVTCNLLVLPAGEHTKSLTMVGKIAESLLKLGMKRDSCIIGLGGGVITDLAGFVASIYMRGVAYVCVPTTLLSMADASMGGKTGVDLAEGKNLIGTFYHPRLIFMDPAVLKTLPEREFRSGMAEIIKHSIIADRALFTMLAKNHAALKRRDLTILTKIIRRSSAIKMKIVKADEHESVQKKGKGVSRMLVNYGHTVGHALEKLSGYTIPHGEAVAIGMVAENRIAVGKNLLKESEAELITALLKKFHLPTTIPQQYSSRAIQQAMSMDKKNLSDGLYFAIPMKIGKAVVKKF